MEFGPRSLGYRSILADPRQKHIKDRINKTIKFREEFRPFAPSVLRECVKDYFSIDVDCPFMTYTLDVRPEKRNQIQGIVHVDGSGRLQTVSKEEQPLYHKLIFRFYELTGIPVVLNTSFNLSGEPIVCSPYDAIRTFYTCGMDALIIGNYLLEK
jgi:carbamoyltransferase